MQMGFVSRHRCAEKRLLRGRVRHASSLLLLCSVEFAPSLLLSPLLAAEVRLRLLDDLLGSQSINV
jgi:hypothetical protein